MLREIRKGVSGFFAKILIILLVVSFAFWGIEDVVNGTSPGVLAQVGGEEVTVAEFQRSIRDIKTALGDQYSPELLKSLNLYQIKLQSLVSSKLLVQEARRLGITISDEAVVQYISKDKSFYSPNGNFDRGLFAQLIRQQGYTEAQYIEALRQQLAARIIVGSLTEKPAYPPALLSLLYQAKYERREALLIHLSPSAVTEEPQASDADLKAYFEKNRAAYNAPEYRTLRYITITPDDVMNGVNISREDVMEAYQQRAGELVEPERRKVSQLLYDRKEQADKAYEILMAGGTVDAAAKTVPPVNKDAITLGWKKRGELPTGDKDVFALNASEFTKPLEGPFGWQVFYVSSVDEAQPMPFKDVKGMLEKELRQNKGEEEMQRLVERLEDSVSAGSTLDQMAEAVDVKVKTTDPIDTSGKTPDNRDGIDVTRFTGLLETAFTMKKGESSDLLMEADGTYSVLQVQDITKAREKTFDEVRGQVIQDWKREMTASSFATTSQKLAEDLIKGKEPSFANMQGVEVERGTVSRDGGFESDNGKSNANLPDGLVSELFTADAKQPFTRAAQVGDFFVIAKLESILPAADPVKDADAKRDFNALKRTLAQDARDEILQQYFTALRKQYPVSVNGNILQGLIQE